MNIEELEEKTILEIKRIREGASLPFFANLGDAGMDICAAEDIIIRPEESVLVPTGLILNIPLGYEVQIRPRSGLSFHTRLRLPNAPGTIDAGYKDELFILMYNTSPMYSSLDEHGKIRELDLRERENRAGSYLIKSGDRICQMVFSKLTAVKPVLVEEFSEVNTLNRGGGFGSSGIKI